MSRILYATESIFCNVAKIQKYQLVPNFEATAECSPLERSKYARTSKSTIKLCVFHFRGLLTVFLFLDQLRSKCSSE